MSERKYVGYTLEEIDRTGSLVMKSMAAHIRELQVGLEHEESVRRYTEQEHREDKDRHARELRAVAAAVREWSATTAGRKAESCRFPDGQAVAEAVRGIDLATVIASVTGKATQEQASQELVDASQELELQQSQPGVERANLTPEQIADMAPKGYSWNETGAWGAGYNAGYAAALASQQDPVGFLVTDVLMVWDVFKADEWCATVVSPPNWDAKGVHDRLVQQGYSPELDVRLRHRTCEGNPVAVLAAEVERLRAALASQADNRVQFLNVDPFEPARGASHPMIPDSWRFGVIKTDNGLVFTHQDNGPFVAYGALVDALASQGAEPVGTFSPMHLAPLDGTPVLLRMPTTNDGYAVGRWSDGHGGGWCDDGGGFYVHEAQGWMSLCVLDAIASSAQPAAQSVPDAWRKVAEALLGDYMAVDQGGGRNTHGRRYCAHCGMYEQNDEEAHEDGCEVLIARAMLAAAPDKDGPRYRALRAVAVNLDEKMADAMEAGLTALAEQIGETPPTAEQFDAVVDAAILSAAPAREVCK